MRSFILPLVLLSACTDMRRFGDLDAGAGADAADLGAAPALAEGGLQLHDAPSLVPGQYVMRLADGVSLDDPELVDLMHALSAGDIAATAAGGTYRFASDVSAEDVARLSAGRGEALAWMEPVIRMFPMSNDPYMEFQWHLPQLRVPEAWAWNRGAGAVVAVVDTGVLRMDALGLADADGIENLLPAVEFVVTEPIVLSDGSTLTMPDDDVGHGTHVASTIAQRTDNGLGGASIAPDASILPIRALGQYGGSSTDVADAIRYAADNGADVVNLSLGSALYSDVIAEACQYAADRGVLLVAASGNEGNNHFVGYPAALETVLSVGAVGPDGYVADYSNRGDALDVVAPGGVPYDTDRNGMYDGVLAETWMLWQGVPDVADGAYVGGYFLNGTSMATATVSGVAALLMAQGATREEALDVLKSTALDLGDTGWDREYGHGMVDAAAALEAFAGPPPEPTVPRTGGELVAGDLVFTELMANPTWCPNDTCEWFEVQNTSDTAVDLQGLTVRDASGAAGTIDASVVLAPGALAVLGRGAASAWDHPDFAPDAFYGTAVTLNNGGDTVFVSNSSGEVAQPLAWTRSDAGVSQSLVGSSWVATDTVADALAVSGEFATPGAL